jgi:hypothetical protein
MKKVLRKIVHLERRFFRALSDQPPSPADESWAMSFLTTAERDLWHQMQNQDRRHSIEVARRFDSFLPGAPRHAVAAALMHDVGKIESRLGTFARVAATLVGSPTKRFRSYHDHERIGADLLRAAGSDPELIALVEESSTDVVVAKALHRADNI